MIRADINTPIVDSLSIIWFANPLTIELGLVAIAEVR